jgi:hypothetical protein
MFADFLSKPTEAKKKKHNISQELKDSTQNPISSENIL